MTEQQRKYPSWIDRAAGLLFLTLIVAGATAHFAPDFQPALMYYMFAGSLVGLSLCGIALLFSLFGSWLAKK